MLTRCLFQVFLTRANITDEPDLEGRTALMWAASKAADNVITMWVRFHPDLHQTDKNGGTSKCHLFQCTNCWTLLLGLL